MVFGQRIGLAGAAIAAVLAFGATTAAPQDAG
jgi:hypothetical protein